MVAGDVGFFKHGGNFKLAGGHFVVAGLGRDAQGPELVFHILHKAHDAAGNGPEVVVFHLLPLGRGRAQKGAAGQEQVGAQYGQVFVHQKVFLLGAHIGTHIAGRMVAEQAQNAQGLAGEGGNGAQQGDFAVQGFAGIGVEVGGDVQGGPVGGGNDEHRHGGVPGGVAARFKSGAQPAGREGRGVRFTTDEHFAGKFADDLAVGGGRQEGVVFFGGEAGHGVEPVRVMGSAHFNGPVFHGIGHHVGDFRVQAFAVADGLGQLAVHVLGQTLAHGAQAEHVAAEKLIRFLRLFFARRHGRGVYRLEHGLFPGGTHILSP